MRQVDEAAFIHFMDFWIAVKVGIFANKYTLSLQLVLCLVGSAETFEGDCVILKYVLNFCGAAQITTTGISTPTHSHILT